MGSRARELPDLDTDRGRWYLTASRVFSGVKSRSSMPIAATPARRAQLINWIRAWRICASRWAIEPASTPRARSAPPVQLAERPDAARARVRAAVDGLDADLAETRRIIHELTPTTVAEVDLEGFLRVLCDCGVRFRRVFASSAMPVSASSLTGRIQISPNG